MLSFILLFSGLVHADYRYRQNQDSKPLQVVEATSWIVGNTWSEKTKKEFFESQTDTPTYKIVWDWVTYTSPLKYWKEFTVRVVSDLSRQESRDIAAACKAQYQRPWDVISCISFSVTERAVQTCDYDCCARVTLAFKDAINSLGWRGLKATYHGASYGDGTLHVINKLIIRSHNGSVYEYVVDALNGSEYIFPFSHSASLYHGARGDGLTRYQQLPFITK